MASPPLKLYWWNVRANFGDAISRHLVSHVSGREVVWASPEECELFAVGSLMVFVRRSMGPARQAAGKPWLWGTGCVGPMRRDFLGGVRIASLRGPLTAEILGLGPHAFGDAALLLPRIVERVAPEKREGIGIVAHHSKIERYRDSGLLADGSVRLIDVTLDDPLEVVRQIASCRAVYSSSLHGLIVADAFHVPNYWLNPDGNHANSRFKFYDYAASVGRGLSQPLSLDEIDLSDAACAPASFTYWPAVDRLAETVAQAFPDDLRG